MGMGSVYWNARMGTMERQDGNGFCILERQDGNNGTPGWEWVLYTGTPGWEQWNARMGLGSVLLSVFTDKAR